MKKLLISVRDQIHRRPFTSSIVDKIMHRDVWSKAYVGMGRGKGENRW